MKIFYAVTTALLLISQQACSEQQSAENTTDANSAQAQTAPAESHTILEPAGDIKESVLGELKQGRWELVMFWATYCPVCKRDFEKLATFIEENPEIPLLGSYFQGRRIKDPPPTLLAKTNTITVK